LRVDPRCSRRHQFGKDRHAAFAYDIAGLKDLVVIAVAKLAKIAVQITACRRRRHKPRVGVAVETEIGSGGRRGQREDKSGGGTGFHAASLIDACEAGRR